MSGTAIKTNGEGQRTKAHLNLTRALGTVVDLRASEHREIAADRKIPYAGKE